MTINIYVYTYLKERLYANIWSKIIQDLNGKFNTLFKVISK